MQNDHRGVCCRARSRILQEPSSMPALFNLDQQIGYHRLIAHAIDNDGLISDFCKSPPSQNVFPVGQDRVGPIYDHFSII